MLREQILDVRASEAGSENPVEQAPVDTGNYTGHISFALLQPAPRT